MKTIVAAALLLGFFLLKQEKLHTQTGKVTFEASVPAFEEIKASSEKASCTFNPVSGEIQSQVPMKSFQFRFQLMQQHFNENYVESDRYPKAVFRGIVDKFNMASLSENPKEFTLQGVMELHGRSKDIATRAKIRKTDAGIEIITDFTLNTDDFGIQIPSTILMKVSKKVNVHSEFVLK